MIQAIVNDKVVPVDYELRNKDRVITLTDDMSYGYREGWIEKANTIYGKSKIKKLSNKTST